MTGRMEKGQAGCRKGRMQDSGKQVRKYAGKEGCRTGGKQEKKDAGKKGCRTGGKQERKDAGKKG